MRPLSLILSLGLSSLATLSRADTPAQEPLSEPEAQAIAEEAYIYFYPLISMDVTRKVMTNAEAGAGLGKGPMNMFHHVRTFPPADYKDVVRPNFDTLYSTAWLDLTKEPVVVSVPDTQGRYYLLPMLEMWTDVFASPGKRTTGTQAAQYVVVPSGWQGTVPVGMQRIEAPTPYVWIIGRTQTNAAADFPAVNAVQDGFKITLLSQWGQASTPPQVTIDPTVDMTTPPLEQVNQMPALDYFRYAAELMKLHKPHVTDQSLLFRLAKLGLVPGKSLEIGDPRLQNALIQGAASGLKKMMSRASTIAEVVNGWQVSRDTMGVYGNSYLKRAIIAMIGLGANQPEDAIYPIAVSDAAGQALDANYKYELHFNKGELPPANAFWSVTMYDQQGFPVPNPLNRFALGDRDRLRYNADGSLDIYIQSHSPGSERESNWLPAPQQGLMGITMRIYAPQTEALEGAWNPPPIRRVD